MVFVVASVVVHGVCGVWCLWLPLCLCLVFRCCGVWCLVFVVFVADVVNVDVYVCFASRLSHLGGCHGGLGGVEHTRIQTTYMEGCAHSKMSA